MAMQRGDWCWSGALRKVSAMPPAFVCTLSFRVIFGAQVVGGGGTFSRLTDAQLGVPPGRFTDAPSLGQPSKRQTIPSLLLLADGRRNLPSVQRTVMLQQGSISDRRAWAAASGRSELGRLSVPDHRNSGASRIKRTDPACRRIWTLPASSRPLLECPPIGRPRLAIPETPAAWSGCLSPGLSPVPAKATTHRQ